MKERGAAKPLSLQCQPLTASASHDKNLRNDKHRIEYSNNSERNNKAISLHLTYSVTSLAIHTVMTGAENYSTCFLQYTGAKFLVTQVAVPIPGHRKR